MHASSPVLLAPARRLSWLAGGAVVLAALLWASLARPVAAAELAGEASRETLPGMTATEASIFRPAAPAAARPLMSPWERVAVLGVGGLGCSFAGSLTGLGLGPSLGLQAPAAAMIGGMVGLGAFGSWAALREIQPPGAGGASAGGARSR